MTFLLLLICFANDGLDAIANLHSDRRQLPKFLRGGICLTGLYPGVGPARLMWR